jgi:chaperone required for assembly of F1-ATPase
VASAVQNTETDMPELWRASTWHRRFPSPKWGDAEQFQNTRQKRLSIYLQLVKEMH